MNRSPSAASRVAALLLFVLPALLLVPGRLRERPARTSPDGEATSACLLDLPWCSLLLTRAALREAVGHSEQALALYERYVRCSGGRAEAKRLYRDILAPAASRSLLDGDFAKAADRYVRAERLGGLDCFALLGYGLAFQWLGRQEEALDMFDRAARSAACTVNGRAGAGNLLLLSGCVDEAYRVYASVPDVWMYLNAGLAHAARGDMWEALRLLQAAERVGPDVPEVHLRLAWLIMRRGGSGAEAEACLAAARGLNAGHPQIPVLESILEEYGSGGPVPARYPVPHPSVMKGGIVPPWKAMIDVQVPGAFDREVGA